MWRVSGGVLESVREAARRRILFLPHAVAQMARPDRMISPDEVEAAVMQGELVEDYPSDPRGPTCLLLGQGEQGRPVHVVCAPRADFLAIITAYTPDSSQWSPDFRRRL